MTEQTEAKERSEAVEAEVVEEHGHELAVQQPVSMRPINLTEFQAWADSRAQALRILMDMGIAQTRAEDWSDQGGKPYPEQGACSAIVNMVGLTISPPARRKENFEDELGHYYIYFLEAEATVPKFGIGPLPIVGRASSRDQFFAMRNGALRPASEIDPGDILAKAYTNLRYRAVKAVVPQVANITWEDLKQLTSGRVAKGKVRQVHYGESSEGPEGEGNCPTCGKGNLILKEGIVKKEGPKKGQPYKMWVCSAGSWDPELKKKIGCQHVQNDPPSEAPPPADSQGNGKTGVKDLKKTTCPECGKDSLVHIVYRQEGTEAWKCDECGFETDRNPDEGQTSGEPDPRVVPILNMLHDKEKKTPGQQMAALAKATQAAEMGLPRGGDPKAWLSSLSNEDLSKIVAALETQ